MPSIVIRLDPKELENPDLDLRYDIPRLLELRSRGSIKEDGYDYEPKPSNAMQIYLSTADLEKAVPLVIELLERQPMHGNFLARASQVGVSEGDALNTREFRIVYPAGTLGVIVVPPFPPERD